MIVASLFHASPSLFREGRSFISPLRQDHAALREATGIYQTRLRMTFQLVALRQAKWLRPYTDDHRRAVSPVPAWEAPGRDHPRLRRRLSRDDRGDRHENAAIFQPLAAKFHRVVCLNDGPLGLDVIETVVCRELGGWI